MHSGYGVYTFGRGAHAGLSEAAGYMRPFPYQYPKSGISPVEHGVRFPFDGVGNEISCASTNSCFRSVYRYTLVYFLSL